MIHRSVILVLFWTSGFAGLIYEVLWMKELGLLFGSTALAAATTLTAFFLGLAVGSYVWGRRVSHMRRPLRIYAMLEACVALSALLYFLLLDTYYAVYAPLFQRFGSQPALFVAVKFVLALSVLFPPSFFMGGTLPVMSQYLVQHAKTLGRTTSILYAVNTCGAALGAFVAGFYLPPWLGFTRAYLVAVGLTGLVSVTAWLWGKEAIDRHELPVAEPPIAAEAPLLSWRALRLLAFLSGFVALSLEVLWTRMFAQVLQNSVYTYSIILTTFLISLALGAGLAHGLIRLRAHPFGILCGLLAGAACLIGLSPFVFTWLTSGLSYVGGVDNWGSYVGRVFGLAGVVMGVPGIVLGSVLPFLLRLSQPFASSPGHTVGALVAVNTVGAIVGSLCAGFVFLTWFGLWTSIRLVAACYFMVVLLIVPATESHRLFSRVIPAVGLLLLLSVFDTASLPLVRVQPLKRQESLYEVWEGKAATVAVIKRKKALKIKVNNIYTVGGSGAAKFEERQAHIPLVIHPQPRSVFFLGMGTGITAGAALQHDVERVVVCELIPEVVEAARKYFQPYVHGLFEDKRATIVVEDGRNYLLGTRTQFDVIIADLFMPWRAGVGSLYTREHMAAARARLREGGLFAQWVPLYQMSRDEFGSIARTMLEVFPLVTWWRGDFFAKRPIIVLVGHQEATPFEPHELFQADDVPFLAHYAGNLTAARALFDDNPLNTDDRPVIEYRAPITHRRRRAKEVSWFVGENLITFMETVLRSVPPERDPYLQALPHREHAVVQAGLSLHRARVLKKAGKISEAEEALAHYRHIVSRY